MTGTDAAPDTGIEAAVAAAQNGSKSALEQVVVMRRATSTTWRCGCCNDHPMRKMPRRKS
jgi:hypothetical protein